MRRLCPAILACFLLAGGISAAAPAQASTAQPAAAPAYVFQSGAGLLVFHVRLERSADFEAVVNRLADVLATTTDPVRRTQAASWRMYRSTEGAKDVALYVFFFDPAVSDADYDPVRVLSEAAPTEAQAYYERLRADVVKIERMGLTRLR